MARCVCNMTEHFYVKKCTHTHTHTLSLFLCIHIHAHKRAHTYLCTQSYIHTLRNLLFHVSTMPIGSLIDPVRTRCTCTKWRRPSLRNESSTCWCVYVCVCVYANYVSVCMFECRKAASLEVKVDLCVYVCVFVCNLRVRMHVRMYEGYLLPSKGWPVCLCVSVFVFMCT
jgi:hypothetical protein